MVLAPGAQGGDPADPGHTSLSVSVKKSEPTCASAELSNTCALYSAFRVLLCPGGYKNDTALKDTEYKGRL